MQIMSWIKSHPAESAIGAVVVGALFIYAFTGGSRGGSAAGDGGAAAAYYSAVAQQTASGNALQAVQIQEQGNTARTQIAADVAKYQTQSDAATQLAYAPFQVQMAQYAGDAATKQALIGALGNVASQPGTTVTNTSHSSGFLGIGGGSKTTTTYIPNTAAQTASQTLAGMFGSILNGGNNYAAH